MTDHPSNDEKFAKFSDEALDAVIAILRLRPNPSKTEEAVLHQYERERARRRHG